MIFMGVSVSNVSLNTHRRQSTQNLQPNIPLTQTGARHGPSMPAPVFVIQRGLTGVQGPVKHEIAWLPPDDLKGETNVHNGYYHNQQDCQDFRALPPERRATQGYGERSIAQYRLSLRATARRLPVFRDRYTAARRCSRVYHCPMLGKRRDGMKGFRHSGLRGCVIMSSSWSKLIHPNKETDHENSRITSHSGRHRCEPASSLAFGHHGCHRPLSTRLVNRKGGRRKTHGRYPIRRRRNFGDGGSRGGASGLGHLLVPFP